MNLEYQVRKLDNGLTCLYVPMDTPGSACSNIIYKIGSANERPGEEGLAHFWEHLFHKGSVKYNKNTPGGCITDLELKGGIENATTSFFRTNYFLTVPWQFIPDVIAREADRMKGIDRKLLIEGLGTECTVVENELERGKGNPMRTLMAALNKNAYQSEKIRDSTIGDYGPLEDAVKDKGAALDRYFERSYTPDNAYYVLAGPFNEQTLTIDQLHEHVEREFGSITRGRSDANKYPEEPPQLGMKTFTIPGDTTMCAFGFKGPKGVHSDSIALKALSRCMKNRMDELEEKGICMQTEVMWDRALQSSLFSMWTVGFRDPDAVRAAMMKVVYDTQTSRLITKSELDKAKVELRNGWIAQLQSAQGVADAFTEAVAMGDANDVNTKFENLAALTPDDLTQASRHWLVDTGLTMGVMYPYKVRDAPMSLTTVPELTSVGSKLTGNVFAPPQFSPSMRLDQAQHLVNSGSEPSNVDGASWKRPGMVQFSVTFTPKVDTEWFAMSMSSLVKDPHINWTALGPGVVMVTYSGMPEELNHKSMEAVWGDPSGYSAAGERGKAMQQGVAYDSNKYSVKLLENSVFKLPSYSHSLTDAVRRVKNSPRRVVSVAPEDSMLHMIHDYFKHDSTYEEYVPPANHAPKSITVQQNKDSVNVLFGQALPNIGRAHKDFIPLNIATAILGYGFHGMLMTRVRVRDGLTYGIESHISPGIFQVGATFPPRNLERGVNDIKDVLADWRSSITEQEFKVQKERLKLMPITLSDNPATYVRAQHTFLDEDRINACSYQDVLNAFDKHIDINNLVQIRVG